MQFRDASPHGVHVFMNESRTRVKSLVVVVGGVGVGGDGDGDGVAGEQS